VYKELRTQECSLYVYIVKKTIRGHNRVNTHPIKYAMLLAQLHI